jgi:hypothetical protein
VGNQPHAGAASILTNFVGGRHGVEIGNSAKDRAERSARTDAIYPEFQRLPVTRSAIPLADASVDARQLRLLQARPMDDAAQRRGRVGNPTSPASTVRSTTGLHGRRGGDGRMGGAGNPPRSTTRAPFRRRFGDTVAIAAQIPEHRQD